MFNFWYWFELSGSQPIKSVRVLARKLLRPESCCDWRGCCKSLWYRQGGHGRGGRRSRVDSVMQCHDAVAGNCLVLAEVKLPGFLPELAGGQISSIPSFVILREIFVVTSADSSAS